VRELHDCETAITQAVEVKPSLMRPPQAAQTPLSFTLARIQGYTTIHWSASGDDWLGDPAEIIAKRILTKIKPGGIILLHDGCEPLYPGQANYERIRDRKPTIEALSILLEKLRGYRFVTISEMIRTYPTSKRIWFT
jgi:chitooligosaccharide deacetylase